MNKKQRIIFAVLVVIIIAAVILVFEYREADHNSALIASGTVEATDAQLGFQTPGRIEDILIHEGDKVKTGIALAHLDQTEMQARRQEAIAQTAVARAVLQELERGFRSEEIAQGRAVLAAAKDRLNDARRDMDRAKKLFDSGVASQEAYDKAVVAFDVAKSQHEQAVEQMRILQTGPRKEKVEAQRAQLAQAEAAVQVIDAVINNMTIRSPFDGIVTIRHREPGEIVSAGSAVLTIMTPDDRWVRIYIPEYRVGAVQIRQSASISSDTYPDKTYAGEVIFIASEAEFTPKSVQTTEERVKLVYAVKVRITGDPTYELKPGMPADVRFDMNKP